MRKMTIHPYTATCETNSAFWYVTEDSEPVATILVRMWDDVENECALVVALPSPFPRTTVNLSLGYPPEYSIERFLSNWLRYLLDEHRLRLETIARELGYSEEDVVECRDDNPRIHCLNLVRLLSKVKRASAELGYSRIRNLIEIHERES